MADAAATEEKASPKPAKKRGAKKSKRSKAKVSSKRARKATKSPSKKATRKRSARGRKRYTEAERARILMTAQQEGLTGAQVSQRFGISTLTYYLWRKKSSTESRRGQPSASTTMAIAASSRALEDQVRREVQQRVRKMLPDIVRDEVRRLIG